MDKKTLLKCIEEAKEYISKNRDEFEEDEEPLIVLEVGKNNEIARVLVVKSYYNEIVEILTTCPE